jgi:hypothetical protein
VQLLASIHESYEGARIEQKLIGHGVNDGLGTPDVAGPNRGYRSQHCRADRERARLGGPPAEYPNIVPRPRAPLPNAFALSVWPIDPTWQPGPRTIASLIDVPIEMTPLHCIVMRRLANVQLH